MVFLWRRKYSQETSYQFTAAPVLDGRALIETLGPRLMAHWCAVSEYDGERYRAVKLDRMKKALAPLVIAVCYVVKGNLACGITIGVI